LTLLRGANAAQPRTLVDILLETARSHPDEPALDNGAQVLTYAELADAAEEFASELQSRGIGIGDRVGVSLSSGTTDLYVAILGTLTAGAAYVPVDADDPAERARLVFGEAGVVAVIRDNLVIEQRSVAVQPSSVDAAVSPSPFDDAWIIFTSGSTGTPKGVAVTHRAAAAFVDAEARLFLQDSPIGPGDRVMAGLSVAFDASCEEMWLAWRYGACLVPVPRSLVKSGVDLGQWLTANDINIVSTVPTLVALWPPESLAQVRLLILGGEAVPPDLGVRLVAPGREVWNTYGPTESTVVACGSLLSNDGPIRIGLPLDGWNLAVVDADGQHVSPGQTGELIIGGVGLARYLDPAKDAEKYAPMPSLGWDRAYRSGDLVVYDEAGLIFGGRADDQVKLGGRRIELGEVDNALGDLPGVVGAAAAIRRVGSGSPILVGYMVVDDSFDQSAAMRELRSSMPSSLVPRLAVVSTLPTRTSGKIDRDALPWPIDVAGSAPAVGLELSGTQAWIAELWLDTLGVVVSSVDDDFFDLGGGSLTSAQLVSRLRTKFPEVTVADVYEHSTVARLADALDRMSNPTGRTNRKVRPTPRKTQIGQIVFSLLLRTVAGVRWLTWVAAGSNIAAIVLDLAFLPTVSWWWVAAWWFLLVSPLGRMALAAAGARFLLHDVSPGPYPRGGKVHLRLWLAERWVDELGATNLSGATWMPFYAKALGATIGPNVDLHSLPPVTGMLTLGKGCSIEPEVDLTGHWLDGDILHIGAIAVGSRSRIGARTTLAPGAQVGKRAEVAPGSAVFGTVPGGEFWSGAPAKRIGPARGPWESRPPYRLMWVATYAASAAVISSIPLFATLVSLAAVSGWLRDADSLTALTITAFSVLPLATLTGLLTLAVSIWIVVRCLGIGLETGHFPVHSRHAWQAWATLRALDEARNWLFPLYASSLTPLWFRSLGARIGREVEISTALMIPRLTTVNDGAFLADDTLIGGYELGGGWLRIDRAKVGKRAFVGNSGMTAPGRKVPKGGLVAVLSAAPRRTKAKAGTSWLGSPPAKLRRTSGNAETSRTYAPPRRLRLARAAVELCRLVPVTVGLALSVAVVATLLALVTHGSWLLAAVLSGVVMIGAGAVAAAVTAAAKWVLIGRLRPKNYPLWSSFVWRNELADTFVEQIAAPWFARPATGTPALNAWLRLMGAKIGQGVWCETYWLPEADLVTLGDGVTVNQGCVVQTHLFHDRVLSMDRVRLRAGSTLGPNSVILPAGSLGDHATVGPVSLVMRGEAVPNRSRWIGNPISAWVEPTPARSDS
jgi:non-ribosomal peptide synthetase-like protein